jgi:hypothetical protein
MRVILAMLCAAAIGVLTWNFGPAIAQTTNLAPQITVTTLTTAAASVVSANPTRRSVRVCNVGGTNAVWIWAGAPTSPKSMDELPAVASAVVSCWTPPNGVVGGIGAQFSAIIQGGSSGAVSVEEY